MNRRMGDRAHARAQRLPRLRSHMELRVAARIVVPVLLRAVQCARWAKSHGRARYRMPMLVYAALLVCADCLFVFRFPGMLWWAPIYCVLCAGSLICAWRRREHSIPANICAVLASSTMAIPVASLGTHGGDAPALAHLLPFGQSILPPLGVEIAGAYALTLFGSVLYVKTMIREQGIPGISLPRGSGTFSSWPSDSYTVRSMAGWGRFCSRAPSSCRSRRAI